MFLSLYMCPITAERLHALPEGAAGVFDGNQDKRQKSDAVLVPRLYQQIGQLKVERDFLAERPGP